MKYLSIQIQPHRQNEVTKEEAINIINKLGYSVEVDEGFDEGKYINLNIKTEDLQKLWKQIKENLLNKRYFIKSTIIACEGSQGWDNYLLLHHYDPTLELDEI